MKTFMAMALSVALVLPGWAASEEVKPGVLRTPDSQFENLPDYDFEPNYIQIGDYRVHYLDEGPKDGEIVLMLHGEPTWSYLYRKMIPVLTKAGYRSIVPDLIGFGRSDKPVSMDTHTYKFHVDAMATLVKELGLNDMTFFGQDWGGLIGLRVVAENESRFARVVIGNTGLPTGVEGLGGSPAFQQWKKMNQGMIDRGDIPTGQMVAGNVGDPSIKAAYDAPFPDPKYKAGALIMPQRVPVDADDPARPAQESAWEVFRNWKKPFLTAFSDGDPITRGGHAVFQERIPGAKGQKHTTIEGAGHFLQEAKGPELAAVIAQFMKDNPLPENSAKLVANDFPIGHTPPGYWKDMPDLILGGCTEPLVEGAVDMRGTWKVIEVDSKNPQAQRMIGGIQRIEQCGNRVVVTSGGVTHDMRCDGTYENGVNDIGEGSLNGQKISVSASFENGVHVLRPKGMPITVERERDGEFLLWRYGPIANMKLERVN
jgi:haloalkane dehalogenase